MTAEDRLRQILLAEAEDLVPDGDGLRRIEQRLAARRSLRAKLIPAVAIAGVVVVASAGALTLSRGKNSLDSPPAHQPSSSAAPTPSPASGGVTTRAPGTPVWPFTSDAQVADWRSSPGARSWASDPVQVTQHLFDDYLKLPGKAQRQQTTYDKATIIDVVAGGRIVSQVVLVQVGRDADGPWSVTGAIAEKITVTQPKDGDDVQSPIAVTGTATDPDTSVHLRLLTDGLLGEGHAMAGRELPWTHSLAWSGTNWTVAALVTNTFNGKGDLSAVTITPVRRSPAAAGTASDTFVAIENGRVYAVDVSTGQVRRQVSFPPGGVTDSAPDRGGDDVVWVRTKADGCSSALIRAGIAGSAASTPVAYAPARRRLPALSAGGTSLAWVEQPCSGGATSVVVRGTDQVDTTIEVSQPVDDLDVRDDGTALVSAGRRLVVLRPGDRQLSQGAVLPVPAGCSGRAPAWDGDLAVAVADCPSGSQLVRYTSTWTIDSAAFIPGLPSPIVTTAVADRHVLFAMENHAIAQLVDDALEMVPNANRWSDPDW